VRAVAKRLVVRAAATAQRIALARRKALAFDPFFRAALGIAADDLLRQRNIAGDDIGAVFGNDHTRIALCLAHDLSLRRRLPILSPFGVGRERPLCQQSVMLRGDKRLA